MTETPTSRGEGRSALLQAAVSELQDNGAGGLSLRAIARRAGVSHAAPKYHFNDRSGLLTAVAIDGFARLNAALESSIDEAGADPMARFIAGGRAYVEFGIENPPLFTLMFRPEELDLGNAELMEQKTAAYGVLNRIVLEGTAAGAFAPGISSDTVGLISWAFLHGLVVLAHDGALEIMTHTPDAPDLAHSLVAAFAGTISAH